MVFLATTLGCASGAPQSAPPRPVAGQAAGLGLSLDPTAAELRTASTVRLSGTESGRLWTFDNLPLERWKHEYEFAPDADWLDRVRLASLRFGDYCSAAFVSPTGLAVTNQHCARECIEAVSTGRDDFVVDGFLASSRREERLCPGLYVDQLVAIEDVSVRIHAAAGRVGPAATDIQRAIKEASAGIEDECEAARVNALCQVVPLYGGARHVLHRYHRYETVKLVFAPELRAAYFGGEYDNFTWPRHALDIAFVRIHDGESPVRTEAYLPLDPAGAAEGDPVFVTGNPGSTSRMLTVAELMYERTYRLPLRIWLLDHQRNTLASAIAANPDYEADLRQDMFEVSNTMKAYGGMLEGLRDTLLVGAKIRMEDELRAKVAADPALQTEYGDVWDRLSALQQRKLDISPRMNATNTTLVGSPHLELAGMVVDYVRQMKLPEAARSPRFRGDSGRRLLAMIESDVPVDPSFAWFTLTGHLRFVDTWIQPRHELRSWLFQPGESVEEATTRLIGRTRILDASFRRGLIDGGAVAIEESADPLIVFARRALAEAELLWDEWDNILAEESVQRRRLGLATCAVYGTADPPDASFTLRISDGIVKRYASNGTYAPARTTFYGLFARSAEFAGAEPWTLPPSFERASTRIGMDTPLGFVSTADIAGGSSGSPVIGTDGRLVGVVFDSNMEQLPNGYLYRSAEGRAVAVHSAGILEALRSVYRANALVAELTGRTGGR
jgi:hypothetical protein